MLSMPLTVGRRDSTELWTTRIKHLAAETLWYGSTFFHILAKQSSNHHLPQRVCGAEFAAGLLDAAPHVPARMKPACPDFRAIKPCPALLAYHSGGLTRPAGHARRTASAFQFGIRPARDLSAKLARPRCVTGRAYASLSIPGDSARDHAPAPCAFYAAFFARRRRFESKACFVFGSKGHSPSSCAPYISSEISRSLIASHFWISGAQTFQMRF